MTKPSDFDSEADDIVATAVARDAAQARRRGSRR